MPVVPETPPVVPVPVEPAVPPVVPVPAVPIVPPRGSCAGGSISTPSRSQWFLHRWFLQCPLEFLFRRLQLHPLWFQSLLHSPWLKFLLCPSWPPVVAVNAQALVVPVPTKLNPAAPALSSVTPDLPVPAVPTEFPAPSVLAVPPEVLAPPIPAAPPGFMHCPFWLRHGMFLQPPCFSLRCCPRFLVRLASALPPEVLVLEVPAVAPVVPVPAPEVPAPLVPALAPKEPVLVVPAPEIPVPMRSTPEALVLPADMLSFEVPVPAVDKVPTSKVPNPVAPDLVTEAAPGEASVPGRRHTAPNGSSPGG